MHSHSASNLLLAGFLLDTLHPEDGGSMMFPNFGGLLPNYTLWEPKIQFALKLSYLQQIIRNTASTSNKSSRQLILLTDNCVKNMNYIYKGNQAGIRQLPGLETGRWLSDPKSGRSGLGKWITLTVSRSQSHSGHEIEWVSEQFLDVRFCRSQNHSVRDTEWASEPFWTWDWMNLSAILDVRLGLSHSEGDTDWVPEPSWTWDWWIPEIFWKWDWMCPRTILDVWLNEPQCHSGPQPFWRWHWLGSRAILDVRRGES
jgi:hypothetical protein